MKQAPSVLTPKDCLYISDILSHTLNLAKKANMYYEMAKDETIKEFLEDVSVLLAAQYEDLIGIMEEETNG